MAQAIRRKNIVVVQQRRKDMKSRRLIKAGINTILGIGTMAAFFAAPYIVGAVVKPLTHDVQSAITAGHTP